MSRHPVALAVAAVFLTAVFGLLLRPLTPIDETRYLAVAWEMHLSGDWLVPTKNFAIYSDKPPLVFWAINLVWLLTGVSEFTARLVVPLFAALAVWLVARLAARLWPDDEGIAGRAALALAGLAVFALSGGLVMFDVPLAVAVLAGLLALASAADSAADGAGGAASDRWSWVGFGAALAMGVLVKGPVILFHLGPAALALPLWNPRVAWRSLPRRLGLSLAVAVGLLALWLVPAAITGGPDYRNAILWHQSAGRLANSFAHRQPWWFYLALLPVLLFPLGYAPALWRAGAQAGWRRDNGLRLCLIWIAGALVLFSLTSGKQLHYLVPELPAVALIVARLAGPQPRLNLLPAVILLGVAVLVAVLAGVGVLPLGQAADLLSPRSALLAWGLLIAALCWLVLPMRGLAGAMLLSLGVLVATNLLIGLTDTAAIYSTHPVAGRIAPHQPDGLALIGAPYHAEFNFAARLTSPVATPADPQELAAWIEAHPRGLVLARVGEAELPWPPQELLRFRSGRIAIWAVADAPVPGKE